jgi:hypothetical protein
VTDEEEFTEDIPYAETRNYVKRVLGSYLRYSSLYGAMRAESGEPRAASRALSAERREPRTESRERRAKSREPSAERREPRAQSREP